jgi:hypothetical protein
VRVETTGEGDKAQGGCGDGWGPGGALKVGKYGGSLRCLAKRAEGELRDFSAEGLPSLHEALGSTPAPC